MKNYWLEKTQQKRQENLDRIQKMLEESFFLSFHLGMSWKEFSALDQSTIDRLISMVKRFEEHRDMIEQAETAKRLMSLIGLGGNPQEA